MRMMTSAHSDLKEVADAVDAGDIFRFLPKSLDEGQAPRRRARRIAAERHDQGGEERHLPAS